MRGKIRMITNETAANSTAGIILSFIVANAPAIQATVLFALSVVYFVHQIRKARIDVKIKEQIYKQERDKANGTKRKRH